MRTTNPKNREESYDLDTAPDTASPEAALNDDLLTQAGLMLEFIDAVALGDLWRQYEAASGPVCRSQIAYGIRMRLAPDV